jgi:hypothetical protein
VVTLARIVSLLAALPEDRPLACYRDRTKGWIGLGSSRAQVGTWKQPHSRRHTVRKMTDQGLPIDNDLELTVYVPLDANCGIYPGSGIVGHPLLSHDDRLLVYFEGGIYGQSGFEQHETRLFHAASRFLHCAPTVARMVLPAISLFAVGTYDLTTRTLAVHDRPTLKAWIAGWKLKQ